MKEGLKEEVLRKLCPEGIWEMGEPVLSIMKRAICRLPNQEVDEQEERFPTTPQGMRVFLDKFFARHYFQVQDSVVDLMSSDSFLIQIQRGRIRLLDIGAGPAVSIIGMLDVLRNILEIQNQSRSLIVDIVINEPCELCRVYAKEFVKTYFQAIQRQRVNMSIGSLLILDKPFPGNLLQLSRVARNIGGFEVVLFSYVLNAMYGYDSDQELKRGLLRTKNLVLPNGFLMFIQDKFNEVMLRKASRVLSAKVQSRDLQQVVYSVRNSNEFQSYRYFCGISLGQTGMGMMGDVLRVC